MPVQRFLLAIVFMLTGTLVSVSASANACKTADPKKAGDVYKCLAQSPAATVGLGEAASSVMGCANMRMFYLDALSRAGVADDSKVAGCRVLAGAIKEFNGKPPIWNQCVDYDGSEQHFRRCMSGEVLSQSNAQMRGSMLSCPEIRQSYWLIVTSIVDTPKAREIMNKSARKPVSCSVVDSALSKNKLAMYGRECLGYKPDNAAHINKCIGNDADIVRMSGGRIDCDTARTVYLKKLMVSSGGQPPDYQIPRCSLLEPVIASINTKYAQQMQAGSAPAAVQNPVQAPAAAQGAASHAERSRRAAPQPAAQAGSSAPSRRDRSQQAAAPRVATPVQTAPPSGQTEAVAETAPAEAPKSDVEKKIDAVNETVEQSKKLFNLFKKE